MTASPSAVLTVLPTKVPALSALEYSGRCAGVPHPNRPASASDASEKDRVFIVSSRQPKLRRIDSSSLAFALDFGRGRKPYLSLGKARQPLRRVWPPASLRCWSATYWLRFLR